MTVTLFVPDLPEFKPLVEAAGRVEGVSVLPAKMGYWRFTAKDSLSFSRKELRLRHALWNSALSGGFCGRLSVYDSDLMTIENEISA